jgi:cysteine dioxygenase
MTNVLAASEGKLSFNHLVQQISQLLGAGGIDSDYVDPNDILKVMDQYISDSSDWGSSVDSWSIEGEPYTRNLIDSGNGNYNLVRRFLIHVNHR